MAQILEPGDYRAKATEAVLGRSSKGTEQIAVKFSLLDFEGQTITWYGYFSEKAFEITMRGLRSAGFIGDNLADLSSLRGEAAPEVVLVIEHDEYNGKVRPRVQFINSTGGMAVKDALDDSEARTFAARMKGRVVAFDKASGAPPAPKAAPRPASRAAPASSSEVPLNVLDAQENDHVSDDIPF